MGPLVPLAPETAAGGKREAGVQPDLSSARPTKTRACFMSGQGEGVVVVDGVEEESVGCDM